jgi:MFS transporter, BCD family, chlorophyll transporter
VNIVSQKLMSTWVRLGPRFLPFADAATPDLPLSRLLRLSLIQVSVGMSLVLLVGTINRVMIVELGIQASIVSTMLCLPLVFAPLRALIGFRSDTHRSVLGWKRIPFIFRGTMVQFGGLAIMPFALLVLSGGGNASAWPAWIGPLMAALAFLLVGAGIHTTQTVGLALATDQALPESRPKVVGLMYVMLLFGTIVSALAFGKLLENFNPGRLVQVIQGSAVITIVLNGFALWKQEPLKRAVPGELNRAEPSFREAWESYMQGGQAMRRLIIVGFGTMAFGMQDVLLEPYGGEILHLTVSATTVLTAALAVGGLLGFGAASHILSRGADPFRMSSAGALAGAMAFIAIIASAPLSSALLFKLGVFVLGVGGGLFSHGTLTATMNSAPKQQAGLALGAWGAVQATAGGVGIGLGGIIRDLAAASGFSKTYGAATGYNAVYIIEVFLLAVTLIAVFPLVRRPNAAKPVLPRYELGQEN